MYGQKYELMGFRTRPGSDGFQLFVQEYRLAGERWLDPGFSLIASSFDPRSNWGVWKPKVVPPSPVPPANGAALLLTADVAKILLGTEVEPDGFSKSKDGIVVDVRYKARSDDETAATASLHMNNMASDTEARQLFITLTKSGRKAVSGIGTFAFRATFYSMVSMMFIALSQAIAIVEHPQLL